MNQQQALDLVREIRGLERLAAVVGRRMADGAAASEWQYAVTAIEDRLRYVRYLATCGQPGLIARADAIVAAEAALLGADVPTAAELGQWFAS